MTRGLGTAFILTWVLLYGNGGAGAQQPAATPQALTYASGAKGHRGGRGGSPSEQVERDDRGDRRRWHSGAPAAPG